MSWRFVCVSFLLALIVMGSGAPVWAQSAGGGLLGPGFALDRERSARSGGSFEFMLKLVYGELPEYRTEVQIFRFDGSFSDAVAAIRVPHDAMTQPTSSQNAGTALGMMLGMFGETLSARLGAGWSGRARQTAQDWASVESRSYGVTLGQGELESVSPGQPVTLTSLQCVSPLVDLINLEIIEGTWVTVATTTFRAPTTMGEGAGGDDDDGDGPPKVEVPIPSGAHWVNPGEVAEDLGGDVNYFIEQPMADVVQFFLDSQPRHCYVEDESTLLVEDEEVPMTTLYCLKHEGPVREDGDDIVAVTLRPASLEAVGDALGRNQGTWTQISINQWQE